MESGQAGKVIVSAKIENFIDVEMREKGLLPADQVRSVEVHDALVDNGQSNLLVPRRLVAQLGLRYYCDRPAHGIGEAITLPMYSAVWLTIQGRECVLDVGEIEDQFPVLIGRIPLEALDWVVDPKGQRLIGNPDHDGDHVVDVS
jgi:predicted aspartyl protease